MLASVSATSDAVRLQPRNSSQMPNRGGTREIATQQEREQQRKRDQRPDEVRAAERPPERQCDEQGVQRPRRPRTARAPVALAAAGGSCPDAAPEPVKQAQQPLGSEHPAGGQQGEPGARLAPVATQGRADEAATLAVLLGRRVGQRELPVHSSETFGLRSKSGCLSST